MNLKTPDFETLVSKLRLETRNSGDRHAWFEHEGRVLTRTKRSFGRGDLPGDLIRQQLKLNESELKGILGCQLGREDYLRILRAKGLA